MKETREIKILTKVNDKYKTFSLEELESEHIKLLKKTIRIEYHQTRIDERIQKSELNKAENSSKSDAINYITSFGLPVVAAAIFAGALISEDIIPQTERLIITMAAGAIMGIGNAKAAIVKPISLPLARVYSEYLGNKFDITNKKRLLVDSLMEAKRLQMKNESNFDNDTSLTQEELELMK